MYSVFVIILSKHIEHCGKANALFVRVLKVLEYWSYSKYVQTQVRQVGFWKRETPGIIEIIPEKHTSCSMVMHGGFENSLFTEFCFKNLEVVCFKTRKLSEHPQNYYQF